MFTTKIYTPNILITNFCNQNCPYCFARELMSVKKLPREMKIQDFKTILGKIKKTKNIVPIIKLFGGEPTLHSEFETIIKLALEKFPFVHIFTNGIISDEKIDKLQKYLPKIRFIINMQTPGFIENSQIRRLVIRRVKELSLKTHVTLSINIYFGMEIEKIISLYKKENLLKNIKHIRLGASNPIVNNANNYSYNRFKEFGQLTFTFIRQIKKISPSISITLDCGFVPCMFSERQKKYIESVLQKKEWGCAIGNIDIDTSLTAFTCYSLSTLNSFRLPLKRLSLDKAHTLLTIRQYLYQEKFIPSFCKKCRHYGLGEKKCSGPCLALNINSKNRG